MRRALSWIVGIPAALLVIAFAVANRAWITVSFDPFSTVTPFAAFSLPLWSLLFSGIAIGIIVGWCACWLAQGKSRQDARQSRRLMQKMQEELMLLRRPVPGTFTPVPPPLLPGEPMP